MEFDESQLNGVLEERDYVKYNCRLSKNSIEFVNLENFQPIFRAELIQISHILKHQDLIIRFQYLGKVLFIFLPTKIERNLWFYSMKNLKRSLSLVDPEQLSKTHIQLFSPSLRMNEELPKLNIPIQNLKKVDFVKELFYSLKDIHDFLSLGNQLKMKKTREKSVDFNQLKRSDESQSEEDTPQESKDISEISNIIQSTNNVIDAYEGTSDED